MLTTALIILLGTTLIQADGGAGSAAARQAEVCERVTNAIYYRITNSDTLTPAALRRIEQVINIDISDRNQLRDFFCNLILRTPAQIAEYFTESGIAEALVRTQYGFFVAGLSYGRRQLQLRAQTASNPQLREGARLGIRYIDALYNMGFDEIDPQAVSEANGFVQMMLARYRQQPGKRSVDAAEDECAELSAVLSTAIQTMPPRVKAIIGARINRVTGLDLDSPTFIEFHCAVATADSIAEIVAVMNQYGVLENMVAQMVARLRSRVTNLDAADRAVLTNFFGGGPSS